MLLIIVYMAMILAEILRGRHPADTHLRPAQNGSPERDPSSFLDNAIADIEQAHVVFPGPPTNDSEPTSGKRHIKNPELTTPPMI